MIKQDFKEQIIKGIKDGLPIALGYLSVSFTFGLLAKEKGLSVLSSVLISLTNLTSAGQFAGLPIIVVGGSILELAFTTLIINMRYLLMSFSLSQKVDPNLSTLQRMILSFGITDEIFTVAYRQQKEVGFTYFLGLMLLPIAGWSLGTFLGAGASMLLPQSVRTALSIAIYGMFLAIILPPAKKEKSIALVILMAVSFSVIFNFVPWFSFLSGGWSLILATLLSAGIGAFLFKEDKLCDQS